MSRRVVVLGGHVDDRIRGRFQKKAEKRGSCQVSRLKRPSSDRGKEWKLSSGRVGGFFRLRRGLSEERGALSTASGQDTWLALHPSICDAAVKDGRGWPVCPGIPRYHCECENCRMTDM